MYIYIILPIYWFALIKNLKSDKNRFTTSHKLSRQRSVPNYYSHQS